MILGIDWTHMNWRDVAVLLGLSLGLSAIALAVIKLSPIFPQARKRVISFFVLLIIWTPVGLITPGVAYGEWLPEQGFNRLPGVGYLPAGIDRLSRLWRAPLPFYQLPWVNQTAPISQQAPGYILSGAVGVLLVLGVTWLFGRWLARREETGEGTAKAQN